MPIGGPSQCRSKLTGSNKVFPEKKPRLKRSLLALNLAILKRETGNEAAIMERAGVLADLAVEVWRAPASP